MDKRRTIQLESLKNQFGWKRLKYLFVVNTRKNAIFPLFVMFGLLVVFTIFGTLAYWFGLFDPDSLQAEGISNEYGAGVLDTLYWSLKHVLDPGAFSEDYSASAGIVIIALIKQLRKSLISHRPHIFQNSITTQMNKWLTYKCLVCFFTHFKNSFM